MIADPPPRPSTSDADPTLVAVADLMERAAATASDPLLFDLSQLLSAVGHASADHDPLPFAVVEAAATRLAYVWLLGR